MVAVTGNVSDLEPIRRHPFLPVRADPDGDVGRLDGLVYGVPEAAANAVTVRSAS